MRQRGYCPKIFDSPQPLPWSSLEDCPIANLHAGVKNLQEAFALLGESSTIPQPGPRHAQLHAAFQAKRQVRPLVRNCWETSTFCSQASFTAETARRSRAAGNKTQVLQLILSGKDHVLEIRQLINQRLLPAGKKARAPGTSRTREAREGDTAQNAILTSQPASGQWVESSSASLP